MHRRTTPIAAISLAALALVANLSGAAQAQSEPVVVVELYTSQGCSSCPPADDFIGKLATENGIVPLALHVDYWDYIGWKDSFADPAYTRRQKAYAKAIHSRTIYTPQLIIGGTDRVEGNRPPEARTLIGAHQAIDRPVSLTIRRDGRDVLISAASDRPLKAPLLVQIVRYDPEETVLIEYGENAGMTVNYHNIVTEWTALGEWPGAEPLAMRAMAPGDSPIVVILQERGPGLIVAAARLR